MKIELKLAFKKVIPRTAISGRIIAMWCESKYYHVELFINNLWVSAMDNEGVTVKESYRYDPEEWDFYHFDEIEITEEHYNTIIRYIKKQDDKKYDFLGIYLSQILPFSLHNRNKWFCSEISVKLLQMFLIEETLDLVPNNTSPADLARLFKLEK